jgi:hypothetical protein
MRNIITALYVENIDFRKIGGELNVVLNVVLSVVSFVKSSAVSSRLFSILCRELGSIHETVLYHTEVQWLSG